jgi:Tfp pilus assembly protein PilZ
MKEDEKIAPPFKKRKRGMIKGRRRSKRFAFPYILYFGKTTPPVHKSVVQDLSDTGAGIKTNKLFNPGTRLYLAVDTLDKSYMAEGVVVWINKNPPVLLRLIKNGMGIKFTRVDRELVDIYEEKFRAELKDKGYVEIS